MPRSDVMKACRLDCVSTPLGGINEDDRQIRRRRARDHVARVLHVSRRVGDDELTAGRGEVAIRHVDRDLLLALGTQSIGEQSEVHVVLAELAAGALDGLELIFEDRLGVVEEAPDERALAVVDASGRGEAEQVHHRRRGGVCLSALFIAHQK
jgi:hemin uptake protein HemP